MSLPPSGFKPDQIGLVDMGDISFYDAHSVTPVFNPWEMGPYAASFGEIVLNVTWDALQPTATSLSTTLIDNAISQLNQFNAQYGTDIGIKLRVWGGFRAPEWAKELGGPPITITGQGAVDPGDYTDQTIGRFWTTDYISAWLGLQNQLAQIYDNNPIIRGISQTAGASATDEPFVPLHGDAPVSAVSNATVNQPALLEAGGYRDAADALTLRAAIASYSQWSTTPLDFTFNNHYLFDSGGHADPNFTLAVLQQARNATRVVQAGNHALRDPLYSADLIVYNQLAADAALKPSIAPNSFQTAAPITFFPAFSDWQAAIADGVALNAGNIELWDFPTTPVVTGFTGLSPAQVQALAAVLAAGTPPPTTYAPDDSSALGFIAPAIVSGAPGTVALTGTNAVLLASTSSLGTYSVVLTSINGNMLGLTDFTGTVIGATTGSTLALSGTLAQINTVLAHLTDSVGSGNDIVQFVATDSSGDVSVRDVGVLATTPPASAAVPTPGTLPAQQSFSISGGNARVVAQGSMASLDIAAGFGNSGMLVLGGVQSSLNVTGNLTVDGNTSLFAQLSPNAYSTATLKVGGAFDVQSGATAFLSGQFTAGQFTNELGGTIRASGQLVSGNGTILNNGMIEATADQTLGATRLVINNSLTHSGAGTGTLQIDAGATLVLNGAVTSQTIKFASNTVTQLANSPYAPSTLVISNAPALSGVTINGFTFADKLVLPNVNITGQAAPTYDSASNTLTVHRQGASDLTFTIDNADLTGLSVNGVYNPLTNQTAITFVAPAGGISPTISVAGSSGPGVPGTLRGGAVGSQTLVPEVVLQAPLTAGADPTTTMFKLEVQVLDGGAVGVSGQTPQTTIVRTDTIANLEGYLETLIYETRTSAIDHIEIKLTNVATPTQTVTQTIDVTNGAITTPFLWAPTGGSTDFSTAGNWTLSGVAQTVQPGGTNTVLFTGTHTATGDGAVGQIFTTGVTTLAGGFVTAQGVGNVAVGVDDGGSLTLAGGEILMAQQSAIVGQTGLGLMTLMGGALALTGPTTSNALVIGHEAGSHGTVLNLEQISAAGQIVVGAQGTGTLELLGVASTVYDNNAEIAQYAGSNGSAIVNGGMWRTYGLLTVGGLGTGSLTINGMKNGITGQVMAANATIGGNAGGNGTVTLDGGNMLVADSTIVSSTLTVGGGGPGTINITNGSEVAVGSAYGTMVDNNGSLVVGGTGGGAGLVRIAGYSSLLVYGDATIGAASGDGSVFVGQSATDNALFALTGDLSVSANGHLTLAGPYATVRAANFDVAAGGLISGAGTLSGDGGGNHTVGLAYISNNGTIQAVGGELLVYGPVEGTGILSVTSGSSMTLQASVGGNETLAFSANAHVTLNDPLAFHGTITGMEQGDVLELASTQVSNAYWTNGVLGLATPDGPLLIRVAGTYGAHTFTVTPDGLGGTNIGVGQGDVHMTSFDGLHYEFQAVGEFVAAQSTVPSNPWEIQIRADGVQGQMSFATEVAADFGGVHVTFAIGRGSLIQVNGAPDMELAPGWAQNFGAVTLAQTSNNSYIMTGRDGQSIAITAHVDHLDFSVALGAQSAAGSVQGLLGSHSGPGRDFQLPDGTVLPQPLTNEEIVGHFADAWRVGAEHHSIL